MIRRPRPPDSAPAVLTANNGAAARERERAEALFGGAKPKKKGAGKTAQRAKGTRNSKTGDEAFAFEVYKSEDVKEALGKLFDKKCAYCESKYAATAPVDVEHWRPKSGVKIAQDPAGVRRAQHPGYYWLASEWTNLLPSCINCNRASRQVQEPTGERITSGKGTLFPLRDESRRAYDKNGIESEEPLLLDPCTDYPQEHLEFVNQCVLKARLDQQTGKQSDRGLASIAVFGLNRFDLVEARRRVMCDIVKEQSTLQKLLEAYEKVAPGDAKDAIGSVLKALITSLVDRTLNQEAFALMSRASVFPFLNSITPKISAVVPDVLTKARGQDSSR